MDDLSKSSGPAKTKQQIIDVPDSETISELPERLLTNFEKKKRRRAERTSLTRIQNRARTVSEIFEHIRKKRTGKDKSVYEPIEMLAHMRMDLHESLQGYRTEMSKDPELLSERRWQRYMTLLREAKSIDMELSQYVHSKKKTITVDIDAMDLAAPIVNLEIDEEVLKDWIKSNPEKAVAILSGIVTEVEVD